MDNVSHSFVYGSAHYWPQINNTLLDPPVNNIVLGGGNRMDVLVKCT